MFLSHTSIIYLPSCRCGALSLLSFCIHWNSITMSGTDRKLEGSHLYNHTVMMSVEQITCYTLIGLPWSCSSLQTCHSLIWCREIMEISRSLGITSFNDYLAIHLTYRCVVFCLYSKMALYNMYKFGPLKIKLHIIYPSHWLHPLFSDIYHLSLCWVLILSFWSRNFFISTCICHLWIMPGQVSLVLVDIYDLYDNQHMFMEKTHFPQ